MTLMSRLSPLAKNIWLFKQPLTRKPTWSRSAVSDLFIWRKNRNWKTVFELTNISALFTTDLADSTFSGRKNEVEQPSNQGEDQFVYANSEKETILSNSKCATVALFDSAGSLFASYKIKLPSYSRRQINISSLAESCTDEFGTFCVLHPRTPDFIADLGSNLAERGYVSYAYRNLLFGSYVHGNLDAISVDKDGKFELLAGESFFRREYRIQYIFESNQSYDLAIVNASKRVQVIQFEFYKLNKRWISSRDALQSEFIKKMSCMGFLKLDSVKKVSLQPGACHISNVNSQECDMGVIIRSNLVMMRPLIFRINKQSACAFHG